MTQRLLIQNGHVITLDPKLGELDRADVLVVDSKIAQIGPDISVADAETVDASGMVVMPGLIDSHRHMWQGVIRNIGADSTISEYFSKIMPMTGAHFRPEDVYIGTLMSALDALNSGVTTLLDWCHIVNTPEHADAAVGGLQDSGARAVFGYGIPVTLNVAEWYGDSKLMHPADAERVKIRYFSAGDQLVTMALAVRGPDLSSFEVSRKDFEFGRALDLPITLHIGMEGTGAAGNGITRLRDAGLLAEDLNFVHCNNCTDAEIKMIADSGGSISVTPVVEMMMGLGVSPTRRIRRQGLRPSLGIDSVTSCNSDMFEQMRATLMVERSQANEESWAAGEQPVSVDVTAREVLEAATIDGARACWLGDRVGSLEPGKDADLILLRAADMNLFPLNDLVSTVVLTANCNNVDSVFVKGRAVKRHGILLHHDLEKVKASALESKSYLYSRGQFPALAR
jgi:5-methylthioadenosine/S-adenosylhomocysteine deaminase